MAKGIYIRGGVAEFLGYDLGWESIDIESRESLISPLPIVLWMEKEAFISFHNFFIQYDAHHIKTQIF